MSSRSHSTPCERLQPHGIAEKLPVDLLLEAYVTYDEGLITVSDICHAPINVALRWAEGSAVHTNPVVGPGGVRYRRILSL